MDINPPVWWDQTGANTTWQCWGLNTSGFGPIEPDAPGYGNMLGTYLTITPSSQTTWLAEYNPYQYMTVYDVGYGVWQLSDGSIDAYVLNSYSSCNETHIWIQITWMPEDNGDCPVIYIEDSLGGQNTITKSVSSVYLDSEWIHSTYEIVLNYNSSAETINISGSIYVDDLVIDTLSVPEPATICLLAAGSAIFFRKNNRNFLSK